MSAAVWNPALWTSALLLNACGLSVYVCDLPYCGGDPPPSYDQKVPAPVTAAPQFDRIGLGNWHSCMLTPGGEAWCWGSNEYGQLGNQSGERCMDDNIDCSSVPLKVASGTAWTQVVASDIFTCGLSTAGKAWCWGGGLGGQLGNGQSTNSTVPVAVSGDHVFRVLATSLYADLTCGQKGDGSLWCWGQGFAYGVGGPAAAPVPRRWQDVSAVIWERISLGAAHACGLDATGRAWCVGSNYYGTLGDGGTASSAVPVPVAGGRVYRDIVSGPDHTCALALDGQVWCWGYGTALGDGVAADLSRIPIAVAGPTRFAGITAGAARTCALTTGGAAWCWGDNYSGVLGDGTSEPRPAPVGVVGGLVFRAIGAGGMATCGITFAGKAYCWGENETGALGQPIIAH